MADTVDAVHVVRCKYCTRKYATDQGCWCDIVDGVVEEDFYCAYGEMMEDEKDDNVRGMSTV